MFSGRFLGICIGSALFMFLVRLVIWH